MAVVCQGAAVLKAVQIPEALAGVSWPILCSGTAGLQRGVVLIGFARPVKIGVADQSQPVKWSRR